MEGRSLRALYSETTRRFQSLKLPGLNMAFKPGLDFFHKSAFLEHDVGIPYKVRCEFGSARSPVLGSLGVYKTSLYFPLKAQVCDLQVTARSKSSLGCPGKGSGQEFLLAGLVGMPAMTFPG